LTPVQISRGGEIDGISFYSEVKGAF